MDEAKYSIKVVAKLTGISPFTIRAWERRYGAVVPMRTSSNRRYYSESDIQKLKLLNKATAEGFNIGSIASLSLENIQNTLDQKDYKTDRINPQISSDRSSINIHDQVSEYLNKSLDSIIRLQQVDFENILIKASIEFERDELINNFIVPLIYEIGERWFNNSFRIAHEHMASSVLIAFLQKLRSVYNNFQDKPAIVCGTPQGQFHELGALLVSIIAASAGYKVIYLGANIPANEIISAVDDLNAKAVCLSLVYPQNDLKTIQYLSDLRKMLNDNILIIVGGRAALSYHDTIEREGFQFAENLIHFKDLIKSIDGKQID